MGTTNASESKGIKHADVRKDFWEFLISRHPAEEEHSKSSRNAYRWRSIPQHRLVVVQFVGEHGVGIFIRGERGASAEAVAHQLRPYAGRLKKIVGANPNFSREATETAQYFFHNFKLIESSRRNNWGKMANWLHRQANAYQSALLEIL
jgi:hypothetical protein